MVSPLVIPGLRIDDLQGEAIASFLHEHIADMCSISPPESKHALDLEGLRAQDITFWSVYRGNRVIACVALKQHVCYEKSRAMGKQDLNTLESQSPKPSLQAQSPIVDYYGEIKSMRVAEDYRGQGIANDLVCHLVTVARERGYSKLCLETGSMPFFLPARNLYQKLGFSVCQPFADYKLDPNSVFMMLNFNRPNKIHSPKSL